jgi:hypothetical protein
VDDQALEETLMKRFEEMVYAAAYGAAFVEYYDAEKAQDVATDAVRQLHKVVTGYRCSEISVASGVVSALMGERD